MSCIYLCMYMTLTNYMAFFLVNAIPACIYSSMGLVFQKDYYVLSQ